MRVLVTRPVEEAEGFIAALAAAGHEPLLDPMLHIERLAVPHLPHDAAAVLLTSRNAVFALSPALIERPVYAVGKATADAAWIAGAGTVRVANGDGLSLAHLVAASLPAGAGALLHLCGTEVRPGLAAALREAGYAYLPVPVYRAEAATSLAPATRAALAEGTIGAVTLFSPRTAAIFRRLVEAGRIRLGAVISVCLSEAVAHEVATLAWREIRVAGRRDQSALIACLGGRAA